LNAKADAQLKQLNRPPPETQAVTIETEINALTIDLQQFQIRQTSPRYAALTRPRPLAPAEIRRHETEQILPLAPASAGMKALDFEANRATAISEQLSLYRSRASARRRRCARRR
jgi:hypothetical protein